MEGTCDGELGSGESERKQERGDIRSGLFRLLIATTMLSRGSAFDVRLRLEFMIRESLGSERLWQWGT